LVTTGGTMEKVYSEQTGRVENAASKVERYLHLLRLPDARIDITPVMNKDSLDMTPEDREQICAIVREKVVDASVVITHGTDTMIDTAKFLKSRLYDLRYPVILTGAMTPLGFERSDGQQNLTESLFAARVLDPGVWIVIHGQIFDPDHVKKDRAHSQFVAGSL
jgi:L-asparaginase